ncbi:zinc finger protein RING-type protein [Fadolivirus algeromassiliense]|jgi:hypothetical protein|uniref:Zinc finger protein RING-type protein n=1 Tax=Fadolivirus FV1/VV64 TaxID=3070911 RepID=A0A7D3QW78_9VIRU|nr:zinc finger protein RING-type protein [Fadolivirus algeromassiliense]QKF94279.1 zinc finger protein RING-type protein [Fadolivirus FV1/VV64]
METQSKLQKHIFNEVVLCMHYGWKQHPQYEGSGQCEVCMDDLKGKYVLETECKHCFDLECIMTTLDFNFRKCPSCNKPYKIQ